MSRRKKKRKSAAGLIVLLLMLLILGLLLAMRAFSLVGTTSPDPTPEVTPYEEHYESGVIIRPLQSPVLETDDHTVSVAPTTVPTSSPEEANQGAYILEDHGELEIIIPEDMDSDGF